MPQTLLILDGANLMQRARFSSRRHFSGGENVTVYSFFRSLRPLVEKFKPQKIVLALEGRPVRRIEMYEGYKATRTYDDSDGYSEQRRMIIELLKHLPIEVVRHPEREADDVIGYFALDGDWDRRVVVSSDTDFIQLINADKRCEIYNPITKKSREAPCDDYIGWKSLVGDGADNIDGFKGVGGKTATKLIENPELLHKFLKKNNGEQKYNRNRELIAFEHVSLEDVEIFNGTVNWKSLEEKFKDLGFWSMTNETAWPKYIKTFEGVENG